MEYSLPPEEVVQLDDPKSGLRGFIVVHSTSLGPAAGGCRIWPYVDQVDAGADALRLATGMTMKNALAGLPLGGGKAVLRLPNAPFSRTSLFSAFGRAVEALGGRYLTAEDVGTGVADMALVARETRHVAGLPQRSGRAGGDPSPWTARGVFLAMEVAIERRLQRSIGEVTVAVQGAGHVGFALCELLHAAGAKLVIAEPRPDLAARATSQFDAEVVPSSAITEVAADVFAPCALGGALNLVTVPTLRARIVCGAANNQLAAPELGDMLAERGVLYAPDYLVNAGGIINVAAEHLGWSEDEAVMRVEAIPSRLRQVLDLGELHGIAPARSAALAAWQAIEAARVRPAKPALAA